jgi:hypothetical protein
MRHAYTTRISIIVAIVIVAACLVFAAAQSA